MTIEEGSGPRRGAEARWVRGIADWLQPLLPPSHEARVSAQLPYALETVSCAHVNGTEDAESRRIAYETDLLIVELLAAGAWRPRVVIEAKLRRVTTHDAITYSQKASAHKAVHPYLRYGIMLGGHGHHPLPGRLYRHGSQFDFMFSFAGEVPAEDEGSRFSTLVAEELQVSHILEHILYQSRNPERDRYPLFHRRLVVESIGQPAPPATRRHRKAI